MSNKENKNKLSHTSNKHLTKEFKKIKCHQFKNFLEDPIIKELLILLKLLAVSLSITDFSLIKYLVKKIYLFSKHSLINIKKPLLILVQH
jgi:hypothetical protein